MTVFIVTHNNVEGEGEIEIVGVFTTLDAARAARLKHAADAVDSDDDEYTSPRWDLHGGLTVYEIHRAEVEE